MDDLTIGLIVSFGGLFMVGVIVVLRAMICPRLCTRWIRDRDGEGVMRLELSPKSHEDFMKGRLTMNLHREITHLYALKGDLSTYKQVARRLGHTYICEFLKDPTRHPMVIHGAFRGGDYATAPVQPGAGTVEG